MRNKGLLKNYQIVAREIYEDIMTERDRNVVAFGMIPANLMATIEKILEELILKIQADFFGVDVDDFRELLNEYIDPSEQKKAITETQHNICVAIFNHAKAAGKMVA